MTLKEYLEDYASPETKRLGDELIAKEIGNVPREKVRSIVIRCLDEIGEGRRDFRL